MIYLTIPDEVGSCPGTIKPGEYTRVGLAKLLYQNALHPKAINFIADMLDIEETLDIEDMRAE